MEILAPFIEKLSTIRALNAVDSTVSNTALRIIINALPHPIPGIPYSKQVEEAFDAISKVLVPRFVGHVVVKGIAGLPKPPPSLLNGYSEKGLDNESLEVLIDMARCYGPMFSEVELDALLKSVMQVLQLERSPAAIRKKAALAISSLAPSFPDSLLSQFVSELIEDFRSTHLLISKRRYLISIIGSLSRAIPQSFGRYLQILAPFVLSALSEQELEEAMVELAEKGERNTDIEELRETALVALESMIESCSDIMVAYSTDIIDVALRYLKYDPNVAEDDEDMDDMENGDDDAEESIVDGDSEPYEDFEEEGGFSDDDEMSWKVRRCAVKVLHTLISTRSGQSLFDDGTLYANVAPAMVLRFGKEREENVKLELLTAMASLVRKTGEGVAPLTITPVEDLVFSAATVAQTSRKRRRQTSDSSMYDVQAGFSPSTAGSPVPTASPPSGAKADLLQLTPAVVRALSPLLKSGSVSTKQGVIILLKEIVIVQRGGLAAFFDQIQGPIIEALNVPGSSATANTSVGGPSATGTTLRIETLSLVSITMSTHSSAAIAPYLSQLVPSVTSAVYDKQYKISIEALRTVEQLVKALTPPRVLSLDSQQSLLLNNLYKTILHHVNANESDLEVRKQAIGVLGVLLGRTSGKEGSKVFNTKDRTASLDVLRDRLRNETTKISAARAINTLAVSASEKSDFTPGWIRDVTLELGAQLRKVDRALRGSSLTALKNLCANPAGKSNIDKQTAHSLEALLLPILDVNDLHLLGPALVSLSNLIEKDPKGMVGEPLIQALCQVAMTPLAGAALDALLLLIKSIGDHGAGQPLMSAFLQDVGIGGPTSVIGRSIGTLLVYGGPDIGIKLENLITEVQTAQEKSRVCLALAVLGEAGQRMGTSSPLTPELFMGAFSSTDGEVRLAASVALGSAGSSNVSKFMPAIFKQMKRGGNSQYLLLHSVKEILQHNGNPRVDVAPFSDQLWQELLSASRIEDNKALGAECLGRLAIIDPKTYIAQLQVRRILAMKTLSVDIQT